MFSPSDYAIGTAAFTSFLLSVYIWFSGHKEAGVFVGIWVPSILSFGTYLKSTMKVRKND